jgi:hypothetical protein
LPFVEAGEVEPLGVADGFASLSEAWTLVVLGVYLAEPSGFSRRWLFALAAASILGLAGLWLIAAAAGAFNTDPARQAADQPSLIDWLVAAAGVALAAGLLVADRAPLHAPSVRGLLKGLVGTTALAAAALVWLTIPPTIGQNLDCRYSPLSTVLPGGHASEPEPVLIAKDESRILPLFELRLCGDERGVDLDEVEPVTNLGDGAILDGFFLLPARAGLEEDGVAALPSGALPIPPGDRIGADEPRALVVRVVGTGRGDYTLGSVRLTYHNANADTFTFATSAVICSGTCDDE